MPAGLEPLHRTVSGQISLHDGNPEAVTMEMLSHPESWSSPDSTCTCARSPSYLYSQVKGLPSNLSNTSETPVMGFASMGLTGTPGWKHTTFSTPCTHRHTLSLNFKLTSSRGNGLCGLNDMHNLANHAWVSSER